MSEYHLEAAIVSLYSAALTYEKTDWTKILELYDVLYRIRPSPARPSSGPRALPKATARLKTT